MTRRIIDHDTGITTTVDDGWWKVGFGVIMVFGGIAATFLAVRVWLVDLAARLTAQDMADMILAVGTSALCALSFGVILFALTAGVLANVIKRMVIQPHPRYDDRPQVLSIPPRSARDDAHLISGNFYVPPGKSLRLPTSSGYTRVPKPVLQRALSLDRLTREALGGDHNYYGALRAWMIDQRIVDEDGVFDEAGRTRMIEMVARQ